MQSKNAWQATMTAVLVANVVVLAVILAGVKNQAPCVCDDDEGQGKGRIAALECNTQTGCHTCVASSRLCKWDGDVCRSEGAFWKGGTRACDDPAPPAPASVAVDLDPAAWFLTRAEIETARDGHARENIMEYSSGNRVELLVDGAPTFAKWKEEIDALGAGGFVYHSGWMVGDGDLQLVPEVDHTATVRSTLVGAMERGAKALVLVWANFYSYDDLTALRSVVAEHAGDTGSVVALDTRVQKMSGTLHQKLSAFRRADGEVVAMVGGVDITYERWDVPGHDEPAARAPTTKWPDEKAGGQKGWVDRHVHIRGPAAADVANTFAQRWNDDALPNPDIPNAASWTAAGHDVPMTDPSDLQGKGKGTHNVQIMRTFSCGYRPYTKMVSLPEKPFNHKTGGIPGVHKVLYPFAPSGEFTVLAALVKFIRNSKFFISVEDQYGLYMEEMKEAFVAALEKPSFQKLVVVQNDIKDTDAGSLKCAASWYKMWYDLSIGYPNKVQLYKSTQGYVHSKTWVFDDALFVTGSANMNRRSYTHDAECDVAVVDDTHVTSADGMRVGKFAHDARLAMWSEHTKLSAQALRGMTIAEGAAAFDRSSGVKKLVFDKIDNNRVFFDVCEASDPNGRCK